MKARVLSALLVAPIVLALICLSNAWLLPSLVAVVFFLSLFELQKLLLGLSRDDDSSKGSVLLFIGLLGVVILGIVVRRGLPFNLSRLILDWSLFFAGICSVILLIRVDRGRVHSWLWLALKLLSVFWIYVPLVMLLDLQLGSLKFAQGLFFSSPLLMIVLPLWSGDIAAIFAGSAWGKRKLAPHISPNKSWEGAIANFLGCVIVAVIVAIPIHLPAYLGIIIGSLIGIFGQLGDLLESALKRAAGVKDSGAIMPGHGGILDRIDSLLLASMPASAVLFWYLQR